MSGQSDTENTEPDNINVGLVATIAVVGALLVVAIAAALTALVRSESSEHGSEIGAFANLGTVKRLKEEQLTKLSSPPAWSDREKGFVSVPIDRAMASVTADIQKNPFLATPSEPKKEQDAGAAPRAAAPSPGGDAGTTQAAPPAPARAPSAEAPAPAASASGEPAQKE